MVDPTDRDLVLRTRRGEVEAFGEVCKTRLNNGSIDQIFPDFRPSKFGFVREG